MQVSVNLIEPIGYPTVISGVHILLITTFLDLAHKRVKLGIYSIKLFAQCFFDFLDKIGHEFAFEPVNV